jgi:hypothetical protein
MSVEEIRTQNRRKELSKWRQSREYREESDRLIKGKTCIWCGTSSNLLIHHTDDTQYTTKDSYIAALKYGDVMCNRCHRAGHLGLVLCQTCREHYHRPQNECCSHCTDPGKKERQEVKKIMYKKRQKEYRRKKYLELKERYGK